MFSRHFSLAKYFLFSIKCYFSKSNYTDLPTSSDHKHETDELSSPSELSNQLQHLGDLARHFVKPLKNKFYLKKIIPYSWNSIFKDEIDSPKLKVEMMIEHHRPSSYPNHKDKRDSTIDSVNVEHSMLDSLDDEKDNLSLYDEIFSELGTTLDRSSQLQPGSRKSLPEPHKVASLLKLSEEPKLSDKKRRSDGLLLASVQVLGSEDASLRYTECLTKNKFYPLFNPLTLTACNGSLTPPPPFLPPNSVFIVAGLILNGVQLIDFKIYASIDI